MFAGDKHGQAKTAIDFYIALFPQSRIERIDFYGPGDDQPEGTVKTALFQLQGRRFMAIDSAYPHAFNFTPSVSLFVECDSEDEIARIHEALSESGQALMPLGNYGFSRRFAWIQDRFGISWQINLA